MQHVRLYLKSKALKIDGRSLRNNIWIVGLPESLYHRPHPTKVLVMGVEILSVASSRAGLHSSGSTQTEASGFVLIRFRLKELVFRKASKEGGSTTVGTTCISMRITHGKNGQVP